MNSLNLARNTGIVLCVIVALFCNPGCLNTTDEEAAIEPLIMKNAQTLEDEDLSGYMSTIHPDSPAYDTTEDLIAELFDMYKLTYDVKSVKVLSIDGNEARVRVRMITSKISGPEFGDNDLTAVHVLKQDGGKWKIYESIIESIDYV